MRPTRVNCRFCGSICGPGSASVAIRFFRAVNAGFGEPSIRASPKCPESPATGGLDRSTRKCRCGRLHGEPAQGSCAARTCLRRAREFPGRLFVSVIYPVSVVQIGLPGHAVWLVVDVIGDASVPTVTPTWCTRVTTAKVVMHVAKDQSTAPDLPLAHRMPSGSMKGRRPGTSRSLDRFHGAIKPRNKGFEGSGPVRITAKVVLIWSLITFESPGNATRPTSE